MSLAEQSAPVSYVCLNGPCAGANVQAPHDATPGTATALPWRTTKRQDRYAVYLLVDYNGQRGLMFLRSYHTPIQAQWKVERMTRICAEMMS